MRDDARRAGRAGLLALPVGLIASALLAAEVAVTVAVLLVAAAAGLLAVCYRVAASVPAGVVPTTWERQGHRAVVYSYWSYAAAIALAGFATALGLVPPGGEVARLLSGVLTLVVSAVTAVTMPVGLLLLGYALLQETSLGWLGRATPLTLMGAHVGGAVAAATTQGGPDPAVTAALISVHAVAGAAFGTALLRYARRR